VARAGLLSFGFVYLHPMVDGNGRISRFLINDVLRRDGAVPAPYIVPVSASLQRADLRPLNYDGALELFSRPFMQQYRSAWSFGESKLGADGVTYNLEFDRYEDANHAWRYPDLTRQVTFLSNALSETIEREMHAEALYLQQLGRARARLKTIIEGPDSTLDRIIRSIRQSRGTISGKVRAEHPLLEREEIGQDVVTAIREEFPW
jgi:Fic family protein